MQLSQIKILHFKKKYQLGFLNFCLHDNAYHIKRKKKYRKNINLNIVFLPSLELQFGGSGY